MRKPDGMIVKLPSCGAPWKFGPCWKVQKALDDQGVAYEVVRGPWRLKGRVTVIAGTGQSLYPAIRFENGSWYREDSQEMARTISEGRLLEKQRSVTSSTWAECFGAG
jgi:hypothetical protein